MIARCLLELYALYSAVFQHAACHCARKTWTVLYGSLHLPFILPHSAMLYAALRKAHTLLAYLFFLTIIAHFAAILFHTPIVRGGIFMRMAPWNSRSQDGASIEQN